MNFGDVSLNSLHPSACSEFNFHELAKRAKWQSAKSFFHLSFQKVPSEFRKTPCTSTLSLFVVLFFLFKYMFRFLFFVLCIPSLSLSTSLFVIPFRSQFAARCVHLSIVPIDLFLLVLDFSSKVRTNIRRDVYHTGVVGKWFKQT